MSEVKTPIWNQPAKLEEINALFKGTICEHVGMEVTEIGDDYIKATMPVDHRTQQHRGVLHGGSSVVLAETLGSIAATLCCKPGFYIVGLDINANHLRGGKPPFVTGIAHPVHIGRSTVVSEIKIYDQEDKLVCTSRLTAAVLKSAD